MVGLRSRGPGSKRTSDDGEKTWVTLGRGMIGRKSACVRTPPQPKTPGPSSEYQPTQVGRYLSSSPSSN